LGHTIRFGNVNGIRLQLVPRTKMLELLEQFADQLSLLNKEKPVDSGAEESSRRPVPSESGWTGEFAGLPGIRGFGD